MQQKKQSLNKNIDFKTTSSLERKFKNIVRSKASIYFAHSILSNFMVGKLLKFFKIRWNFFGGKFDYSLVSDKDAAKIFWGIWESAEIRFAKRFAFSSTIIELGSSVGVTLGVLSNIRQHTKFICIEAASENFEKLNSLKTLLPTNNEYILVNKAIAYGVDKVSFEFTSATGSKINEKSTELGSYVDAITLSDVLEENQIESEYTLIADIEGAEEAVFFKDEAALKKCVLIIAELENTSSHTIDEQISKLQDIGFGITERYGCVVVMSR